MIDRMSRTSAGAMSFIGSLARTCLMSAEEVQDEPDCSEQAEDRNPDADEQAECSKHLDDSEQKNLAVGDAELTEHVYGLGVPRELAYCRECSHEPEQGCEDNECDIHGASFDSRSWVVLLIRAVRGGRLPKHLIVSQDGCSSSRTHALPRPLAVVSALTIMRSARRGAGTKQNLACRDHQGRMLLNAQ